MSTLRPEGAPLALPIRPSLRKFDYVRAHNRVHAQYHSDRTPGIASQDEGPSRNQVERGRPTAFGRTNPRLGEDGCPDPSKHAHTRGRGGARPSHQGRTPASVRGRATLVKGVNRWPLLGGSSSLRTSKSPPSSGTRPFAAS